MPRSFLQFSTSFSHLKLDTDSYRSNSLLLQPMTPGEQGVPVPPVPTDTSTVPQTTTPVMESPVQTPPGAVSGVSEVSGVSGAGS